MKTIKTLILLNVLLWALVRFYLRPLVSAHQVFDLWFTGSYPSFGLVFGFTLIKYSFFTQRNRVLFMCFGYTLGGVLYELLGQGYLHFGTFSIADVIYTLLGGVAAYLVLKNHKRQCKIN